MQRDPQDESRGSFADGLDPRLALDGSGSQVGAVPTGQSYIPYPGQATTFAPATGPDPQLAAEQSLHGPELTHHLNDPTIAGQSLEARQREYAKMMRDAAPSHSNWAQGGSVPCSDSTLSGTNTLGISPSHVLSPLASVENISKLKELYLTPTEHAILGNNPRLRSYVDAQEAKLTTGRWPDFAIRGVASDGTPLAPFHPAPVCQHALRASLPNLLLLNPDLSQEGEDESTPRASANAASSSNSSSCSDASHADLIRQVQELNEQLDVIYREKAEADLERVQQRSVRETLTVISADVLALMPRIKTMYTGTQEMASADPAARYIHALESVVRTGTVPSQTREDLVNCYGETIPGPARGL